MTRRPPQTPLPRRLFLKGAGATLALPLLPSLLTPAEAAAQAAANSRRYVHLATHHGGVWASRMFPTPPAAGVQARAYAGRTVRAFPLQPRVADGVASLSPVLSAPSSALTARLAGKMNVLQGLDVPWYLAHHTGGHLGNFARNDGNGAEGQLAQTRAVRRTVDQVMGWSPAFYGDAGGVRERVLVLGSGMSFDHANPATRTGAIQEVAQSASTPLQLFDTLFPQQPGAGSSRPLIVDRVLENYRRLRGSARLGAADRQRLDDHVQRVFELQRRLQVTSLCTTAPPRPSGDPYAAMEQGHVLWNPPYSLDPVAHAGYFQALTDVVVLALTCGLSRVAVMNVQLNFSSFEGDWHQQVAHESGAPDGVRQGVLAEAHRRFFADVMVELAQKLDAVDLGDGRTLLDASLAVWTQECGNTVHNQESVPVVAFGSADGALRTGLACDYRNLAATLEDAPGERRHPGLLWHQWLGTVLQSMGVPKAEWENPSVNPGYPDYRFMGEGHAAHYPEAVWASAGEVLPFLGA